MVFLLVCQLHPVQKAVSMNFGALVDVPKLNEGLACCVYVRAADRTGKSKPMATEPSENAQRRPPGDRLGHLHSEAQAPI